MRKGQYIKNAAIHDTYNRCVTVHGTNFLRVENNVTYNTVGHCFFLEDGIEHGNEFVHNLAIQTKCHTTKPCVPTNLAAAGESPDYENRQAVRANGQHSKDVLLPSDNTVASLLDHQSGQHLPRQRGRGFRRERLLDVVAGAPATVSSKARRSARPPGRVERHSASSRATSPTPTTTRSCSTGTSTPNNTFGVTGSSHTGHGKSR